MQTILLYKPANHAELKLIERSSRKKEFPLRLAGQVIFDLLMGAERLLFNEEDLER